MDNNEKSFDWAFGLNRLTLKVTGLWPYDSNKSSRPSLATPIITASIFIFLIVPQMYALVKVRRDLSLVVDNIPVNLCNSMAVVKLIMLWKGRKVLESLISEMWIDWQCTTKSDIETRIMQVQANHCRLISFIGCASSIVITIIWLILPLFHLSVRTLSNITDPDPMRLLIFQSYYPYDVFDSPMYELTYLQQFIVGSLVPFILFVAENLFLTLVLHACGQCQIIEGQFQQLGNNNCSATSRYFDSRIRQIVNRHVRLIRFVDNIEILFSYLIITQTVVLSLVIGCFGFTALMPVDDEFEIWQMITRTVSPLILLMYVLVDCGGGEYLIFHSSRLLSATYETNLSSLRKDYGRDIIVIMMRCQIPLQLTAGNFYILTLNNFLQLVKNIGAYMSMLITVNQ
ncbi:uncharacterized protein LOC131673321 [Phymastichus coffea]|uniref:uncharacterized protein LOC131673321 n=1 Tax=Phymastichus coffea TaxID=108790 RepID=UPI00273B2F1A|nr:uncharacterized protein LOC131673321 [Phymastichus coffea]